MTLQKKQQQQQQQQQKTTHKKQKQINNRYDMILGLKTTNFAKNAWADSSNRR